MQTEPRVEVSGLVIMKIITDLARNDKTEFTQDELESLIGQIFDQVRAVPAMKIN